MSVAGPPSTRALSAGLPPATHGARPSAAFFGWQVRVSSQPLPYRKRPTAPRSPWPNGCVERPIGSIRRGYTDHVVVFADSHLRRLSNDYMAYYNDARTHLSVGQDAPNHRPFERFGRIIGIPALAGLHHRDCRIELLEGTPTKPPSRRLRLIYRPALPLPWRATDRHSAERRCWPERYRPDACPRCSSAAARHRRGRAGRNSNPRA
jgi:hypothetical protein